MTFGQQKYNDLEKVKETSHLSRKTLSIFFWPKQKLREAKLFVWRKEASYREDRLSCLFNKQESWTGENWNLFCTSRSPSDSYSECWERGSINLRSNPKSNILFLFLTKQLWEQGCSHSLPCFPPCDRIRANIASWTSDIRNKNQ